MILVKEGRGEGMKSSNSFGPLFFSTRKWAFYLLNNWKIWCHLFITFITVSQNSIRTICFSFKPPSCYDHHTWNWTESFKANVESVRFVLVYPLLFFHIFPAINLYSRYVTEHAKTVRHVPAKDSQIWLITRRWKKKRKKFWSNSKISAHTRSATYFFPRKHSKHPCMHNSFILLPMTLRKFENERFTQQTFSQKD